MRKGKIAAMLLSVVVVGCLFPTVTVFATEENAGMTAEELAVAQWKAAANESLAQYGAKSPYYQTGQWNNPEAYMTVVSYDWFDYNDYSDWCDPFYGICLLKNVFDTSQVEATPSVGVVNVVNSGLAWECLPDFSNWKSTYFSHESIGITEQELAAIPLPAACTSWRNPQEYEEELLNYSLNYHNLLWEHRGGYYHYKREFESGITGRKMMELPIVDAFAGDPIGCNVSRYTKTDTYDRKCYNGAVSGILVRYPYTNCLKGAESTFSIDYGSHAFYTESDRYYEDVWTIRFEMYPNEMDMQQIHGLLRLITPDAEEIYAAIKKDLYGARDYAPWKYPGETYRVGYAPWKYYDKWYDIGTQSRIRSSYFGNKEESSKYVYMIAPRVGVVAPGYDIR